MFAYVRLRSLSRKKVLRVRRTATGECKMHEMMTGLSRSVATASQAKSDQIRPNAAKCGQIKSGQRVQTRDGSCRRDADSGGAEARPPPPMRAPPLPATHRRKCINKRHK